jgi:hypothetical protein
VDIGIKRHVQKQIKVIEKDLKDAYGPWKQLQPGNQASPLRNIPKEIYDQVHATIFVTLQLKHILGYLQARKTGLGQRSARDRQTPMNSHYRLA